MIWVILFCLTAIYLAFQWDVFFYGEPAKLTVGVCVVSIVLVLLTCLNSCSII
jgi:hypothetical protein